MATLRGYLFSSARLEQTILAGSFVWRRAGLEPKLYRRTAMQGQGIMPHKETEAAARARSDGTSFTSLVLVVAVLLAIAAFFVVTTAPLTQLLGESGYAAVAAFHGLSAG